MRRVRNFWLCLIPGLVFAHNVTYSALQDIKLCVDKDSVQVTVNVQGEKSNEDYKQQIQQRLETSLRNTLRNHQVPFDEKKSCSGSKGFIVSIFATTWSDKDSPEPYYVLLASTQVGEKPPQDVALTPDIVLGNNVFDGFVSSLLLESDFDRPFEEFFPESNEDGYKDLALAWWEDNPNGIGQIAFLPQRIGAGIVAFILLSALVVMLLKQRKQEVGGRR
jgi:hypothetical protein